MGCALKPPRLALKNSGASCLAVWWEFIRCRNNAALEFQTIATFAQYQSGVLQ